MAAQKPDADSAQQPVREAVRRYAARQPGLVSVTDRYVELIRTLLDEAGIDYLSVRGRTKSVASFAAKASRLLPEDGSQADPLEQITDQIGVRVITYVRSDVAAVAELLDNEFTILHDRDLGEETARAGRFGYASRHLLVQLDAESEAYADDPDTGAGLAEHRASVQVRTVLQHAWAEFEHDFLARHYSDAGWSHSDHYVWIAELLGELGINSLTELGDLLTSVDTDAIITRMGYRYPTGAVRRLDDALLAIFGEQYVALPGNSHRVSRLRTRLAKLAASEG